ncbi:MAG TPA: hypothetical protein EYO85_09835 [Rhodospirillales bacterium]|nr:hypothetical protein [Rhodospirillales bacterium]
MLDDVLRQVEQFLYREARLLDNRQFHQWLELLTDDIRYWIPMRSNRYAATSKSISIARLPTTALIPRSPSRSENAGRSVIVLMSGRGLAVPRRRRLTKTPKRTHPCEPTPRSSASTVWAAHLAASPGGSPSAA